jgi:hypothetical protein
VKNPNDQLCPRKFYVKIEIASFALVRKQRTLRVSGGVQGLPISKVRVLGG